MKLYTELASWWPIMSAPDHYVEEAAFYRNALRGARRQPIESLLELGSGGGNNAFAPRREHAHRQARPRVRCGVRSRRGVLHGDRRGSPQGDRDRSDSPPAGGVALFAPDFVAEITSGTDHGGHDGARRSMRYLEWRHDPDRSDSTYVVDYAYVWRDRRTVHVEHDRHVEGLFSRDTWLGLLTAAGFDPRVVPFDHSEFEEDERHEVFVCVRRSRRTLQPVTRSSAR